MTESTELLSELLSESRLGTELSQDEATKLANLMHLRELKSGEHLIVEGTVDDSLHVILEGNIEVVKRTAGDGVANIAVIREGNLAGELSFIDGDVHTVGLRTLSDSKVLSLARVDFEKLITTDPLLVYKVMRAVTRSAHRIMHQMNDEFIELNNYIFKQHGRY
jgi:CRP/FNR family cyclic AMP-dependent transcriptional regulator